MLEIKDNDKAEKESDYYANMAYLAELKFSIVKSELKDLGEDAFISVENDFEATGIVKRIPVNERQEILRFIKKYSTCSNKELGKHYFKESEYFPMI